MGRKSQDINIILKFPEGKEKEVKEHINKVLTEWYAEAIVNTVKKSVPEKEIPDAVKVIKRALKK